MNVLDLFSGIGGFSLGLERAGMRTVAFCERDEFCRAVLRKHWPDVPCWTDIRGIDADGLGRLGRVDLVCGGFPCQPFSVAGKQKAQEDDRHLWPEMRRVIALARPAWVIGENVAGIIPLALDDVLFDLESLGYATRTFVIPACAVDAKHRRDRVWIIAADPTRMQRFAIKRDGAASNSQRDQLRDEPGRRRRSDGPGSADDGAQGTMADSTHDRWTERGGEHSHGDTGQDGERPSDLERSSANVANARRARLAQREALSGGPSETSGRHPGLHTADASHANGVCEWLPEPDVGRVAHGVSRRVDRLKSLGNAVVPQVVEEIGRAIMSASHYEHA